MKEKIHCNRMEEKWIIETIAFIIKNVIDAIEPFPVLSKNKEEVFCSAWLDDIYTVNGN